MGFKVAIVLVCLFALTAARNFRSPFRGMSPFVQKPSCIEKNISCKPGTERQLHISRLPILSVHIEGLMELN